MKKTNHYDQCSIEVSRALGRDLEPEERAEIGDKVAEILQKYGQADQSGDITGKVLKAIDELSKEIQTAALVEKRNRALNENFKIKMQQYLSGTWGDNPAEGLRALFGDSLADRQGARNGVMAHTNALSSNYVEGLTSRLAKKDLLDVAQKGVLDKETWLAMVELKKASPSEDTLKNLPKEAIEIAKIFNDYNDLTRVRANKAGAWIGELPGYVVKRSHDVSKIQKAAGPLLPVNSEKHFEAWRNFVYERLDWEKTMPNVPEAKKEEILQNMFQQFSNGYHIKFGEGGTTGLTGIGNIGKRLSHERVLHFKTPEFDFEYQKAFGQGDTLAQNMVTGLMRMGRDTAIMEKLGPNAKANIDDAVKNLAEKLTTEKKGNLAAALLDEHKTMTRAYWPFINGETGIPGHSGFAAFMQGLRLVEVGRTLGRILFSAFTDPHYYGATTRFFGERNLKSYLGGMAESVHNILGGADFTSAEKRQLASELGVMTDVLKSPVASYHSDMSVPGRLARWTQNFFKYNLQAPWSERMKLGAVMGLAHRHAMHVEFPFKELPEGMQAALRQFDISPAEWEVIRKSGLHTDSEGRTFLNPENVLYAPKEIFDPLLSGNKTGKSLDSAREAARKKIVSNYRAMFSEIAAMASSQSGGMERAMMLQGTKPGTPEGEFMRTIGLLKGFTTNVLRKHAGRELFGYHPDRVSLPKAMTRMFSGDGNGAFMGMLNFVAFGSVFGYISMTAKDLAKGKTPRVPETGDELSKVFFASIAQGGSMGIYGDFLFGDVKSRYGHTVLETMAGPVAGSFVDLMDIWGRVRDGDDAAAKTFNFILNHTPGVSAAYNVFYVKLAMDYLLMYQLQELMNPGSLRRMERRMEKEQNQSYLFPPSEYSTLLGF